MTVKQDPTCGELEQATRLILVTAMAETASAFKAQELDSLLPERDGLIIVTRGRLGGECLSTHLGVSSLPILIPGTRAAYLFM